MAESKPPKRRRATLQDVADRASVSRTTASFVLNGRDDMRISEAASERVKRAAQELDYRPNMMARSLTTHQTRTLGLISDGAVTEGYTGEIIAGAVETAARAGHTLYIVEFSGDERLRDKLVADLIDREVDGFVFCSASGGEIEVDVPAGSPVVVVNGTSHEGIPCVIPDDAAGAAALADHVVSLGDTSGIWLVGETPPELRPARERLDAIRAKLRAHGAQLEHEVACNWWPESAYDAVGRALDQREAPRALICLNDRIAMGCYQALRERGLSVPTDIKVASFDDSPLATWLRPQLTSVRIPYRRMGAQAVELVLSTEAVSGTTRLPMALKVRASSGTATVPG